MAFRSFLPVQTAAVLVVLLLAGSIHSAQALTLATNTITVTESTSLGQVTITSTVEDNYLGDFTKLLFTYEVTNLSFDPVPGATNGLSGFEAAFSEMIFGVADQFGPAGWGFNCCGIIPPFGAEWDIMNSEGMGLAIGDVGVFGFTVPATYFWTDAFTGSWMHTWRNDNQVRRFYLEDDSSGLSILTPTSIIPEPGTVSLVGLGLLGVALRERRRARH